MNPQRSRFLLLLTAILFLFLFKNVGIGMNLFLFNLFAIVATLTYRRGLERHAQFWVLIVSLVITACAVVINNGSLAVFMNILNLLCYGGYLAFPQARSVFVSLESGIGNLYAAQGHMLRGIGGSKGISKGGRRLRKSLLYFFPFVIILIFLLLYIHSNTLFEDAVKDILDQIGGAFAKLWKYVDGWSLWYLLMGLLIGGFLFYSIALKTTIKRNERLEEALSRVRRKREGSTDDHMLVLKDEYKVGVFLLIALNLMLFGLNLSDIKLIWIDFNWDGSFLKPMLHRGTYLLIVSILISMGILLYFFRSNLNFYAPNGLLKKLSYIWLVQNSILSFSVLIRVKHYVDIFNLAHLRIGVCIFVMLCLVGLFLIYRKISGRKTVFYLIKHMSAITLIAVSSISLVDWDRLIAKHNFNHRDTAFVHLDYLIGLDDSALPYMNFDTATLKRIESEQEEMFRGSDISKYGRYMKSNTFKERVDRRIDTFKRSYPQRSWLEWNLAHHNAYRALTSADAS